MMNCQEVSDWLLMSESPDELPDGILRHLAKCGNCAAIQQQILSVEQDLSQLSVPVESALAKQDFLNRLDDLPAIEESPPANSRPRAMNFPSDRPGERRFSRLISVAIPAAVLGLMFLAGWLAAHFQAIRTSPDSEVADEFDPQRKATAKDPLAQPGQQITRRSSAELRLLASLIDNHIQLATAESPDTRCALVADLSELLWREMVRQAAAEPTPNLLLLQGLYSSVTMNVLPRCVTILGPEDEPLRDRIVSTLKARKEDSLQMTKGALPVVNELIFQAGELSDEVSEWIASGKIPPEAGRPGLPAVLPNDLLATTVAQSLKLAEEEDPLRRADQSNELANHLSQLIIFTSLGGDSDASEELGTYLGDVIDYGVMANLARYEPKGDDDPRGMEYEQIKKHSERAVKALQRNLRHALGSVKKSLERALDAKEHGKKKRPPHDKPKGPPHDKPKGPPHAKPKGPPQHKPKPLEKNHNPDEEFTI